MAVSSKDDPRNSQIEKLRSAVNDASAADGQRAVLIEGIGRVVAAASLLYARFIILLHLHHIAADDKAVAAADDVASGYAVLLSGKPTQERHLSDHQRQCQRRAA